jgi:hypothetical protein
LFPFYGIQTNIGINVQKDIAPLSTRPLRRRARQHRTQVPSSLLSSLSTVSRSSIGPVHGRSNPRGDAFERLQNSQRSSRTTPPDAPVNFALGKKGGSSRLLWAACNCTVPPWLDQDPRPGFSGVPLSTENPPCSSSSHSVQRPLLTARSPPYILTVPHTAPSTMSVASKNPFSLLDGAYRFHMARSSSSSSPAEDSSRPASPAPKAAAPPAPAPAAGRAQQQKPRTGPARGGKYYARGGKPAPRDGAAPAAEEPVDGTKRASAPDLTSTSSP